MNRRSLSEKSRNFAKTLFLIATFFALIFVSGCSLLPKEELDDTAVQLIEPPPSRVVVYEVQRGYIAEEVRALGTVVYSTEESLYFKRSGRIRSIYCDDGDYVKKGQVLAELEVGDLPYLLEAAKLTHEKYKNYYNKIKKLSEIEGSISQDTLRNAELDMNIAKVEVDRLNSLIDGSTLRAPFDRMIVSMLTSEGSQVAEYQEIIIIGDPSDLEIQAEVPREMLNRIRPGMKVRIKPLADSTATPVFGRIVKVAGPAETTRTGSQDRRVSIKVDDPSFELLYGDLLSVEIVLVEKEDALIIPKAALREYLTRKYVRVIEGDARREADVVTGIEGSTHVEIISGLNEGELIIGK